MRVVYEARLYGTKRVRLWIKGTARRSAAAVVTEGAGVAAAVVMPVGMMMGGRILGHAIRSASHSTMTTQVAFAAFAGIVMMLASMAAYHIIFMRPILRHLQC